MPHESTASPPSDEQLACRAQQGCAASFEELVRRYQVPLLHFLRQRAAAEDAEDLVQDTFVRAYENLHRYRPAWRFTTWLFTIARRLSINHQRRRRPKADRERLDSLQADTPQPEQLAAERESRHRLWDLAAEVLTEQQNTALWMHYAEGMPIKQIAHVLGRSRVAVKTMLFRARRKLLPILQDMEPYVSTKHHAEPLKTSSRPAAKELTNG